MDILKLGSELLARHLGGSVDTGVAQNALTKLLGGGDGQIDIAGLVSQFAGSGGIGDIVGSWLGDGGNQAINPAQLLEMFGDNKLAEFAGNLGVDQGSATDGLANVLPEMIDKGSSGGNLLDSVGGLGGALGMAKKLF